jgi:isoquinoline 1-oxidoreductase alpha subunit
MPPRKIIVNGVQRTVDADADTPLLWILRDWLGLTGTKFGCGVGLCGSCTVLVDGEAVRSCSVTLASLGEGEVTTIEGLAADGDHPLQRAWLAERVSQCGYCQPGQIMTAAALLARNPRPTDGQIDAALKKNLCRCGTYLRIRRAIRRASREGSAR